MFISQNIFKTFILIIDFEYAKQFFTKIFEGLLHKELVEMS